MLTRACCVSMKGCGGCPVGEVLIKLGCQARCYSKKGEAPPTCCADNPQTAGRQVEPWPRHDAVQPCWRCECPTEPQPPNYDPYKIRVPEVVVPPLPKSNAKGDANEGGVGLFNPPEINFGTKAQEAMQDMFANSPILHPDYWKDRPPKKSHCRADNYDMPRLGYHGKSKYKFAFHEPWNPLDRVTLLAEAEKEEAQPESQLVTAGEQADALVRYGPPKRT